MVSLLLLSLNNYQVFLKLLNYLWKYDRVISPQPIHSAQVSKSPNFPKKLYRTNTAHQTIIDQIAHEGATSVIP